MVGFDHPYCIHAPGTSAAAQTACLSSVPRFGGLGRDREPEYGPKLPNCRASRSSAPIF